MGIFKKNIKETESPKEISTKKIIYDFTEFEAFLLYKKAKSYIDVQEEVETLIQKVKDTIKFGFNSEKIGFNSDNARGFINKEGLIKHNTLSVYGNGNYKVTFLYKFEFKLDIMDPRAYKDTSIFIMKKLIGNCNFFNVEDNNG
ncbi:MAG: hypothetical protein ACOCRX_09885 [Candidatus Woesearchaeota archaeon]